MSAAKRLKRYRAGVPPEIVVKVSIVIRDDPDYLRTYQFVLNSYSIEKLTGKEPRYGWSRQRRNVTKTLVMLAVDHMLRDEENPEIYGISVYSNSLVWWTPTEKDGE